MLVATTSQFYGRSPKLNEIHISNKQTGITGLKIPTGVRQPVHGLRFTSMTEELNKGLSRNNSAQLGAQRGT